VNTEALLNPEQIADWLAERGRPVTSRTVRTWLAHGELKGRKLGRGWVMSLPELREAFGIVESSVQPVPTNVVSMIHSRRSA
jgi:hypothetical protein